MYFEIYREGVENARSRRGLFGMASRSGQWRWRLRAANHETVASGESYRNKADCLHAIELLKATTGLTPVLDAQEERPSANHLARVTIASAIAASSTSRGAGTPTLT